MAEKNHSFLHHVYFNLHSRLLLLDRRKILLLASSLGFGLLACVGYQTGWVNHVYRQWEWLLYALSPLAAYPIAKRIHLATLPLIASAILSALYAFHNPESAYKSLEPFDYFFATRQVAISLSCFLIVLLSAIAMKRHLPSLLVTAKWIALLGAGIIFYQTLRGVPAPGRGGFWGNASMAGSFLVLTLPLQGFLGAGVILAAVLCTKASVPLGAFAAYLLGFWRPKLLYLVLFTLFIFTLGYGFLGKDLLNSSGRTGVWQEGLAYLLHEKPVWVTTGPTPDARPLEYPSLFLGAGLGSSQFLIPRIQLENYAKRDEIFIWFHNDLFQWVFETGLLGLLSLLLFAFTLFFYAYQNDRKLGSLFSLGVVTLLNFPVHSATHAILLLILLFWILDHFSLPSLAPLRINSLKRKVGQLCLWIPPR